jgi:hypothetical protein
MWPEEAAVLPDVFTEQGGYATSALFNDERALIRAICAELGLNPKGSAADVAARLAAMEEGAGGVGQEVFDALAARVAALEGAPGGTPTGAGTLAFRTWQSQNIQPPFYNWNGGWGQLTFDTMPTQQFPGSKLIGQWLYDGRTYHGLSIDCSGMTAAEFDAWGPKVARVTVGSCYQKKYGSTVYDWGNVGVRIDRFGGYLGDYVREVKPFTEWPLLKPDGTPVVTGEEANCFYYASASYDLLISGPSRVWVWAWFMHSLGQQNPVSFPNPATANGCGWKIDLELLEVAP